MRFIKRRLRALALVVVTAVAVVAFAVTQATGGDSGVHVSPENPRQEQRIGILENDAGTVIEIQKIVGEFEEATPPADW